MFFKGLDLRFERFAVMLSKESTLRRTRLKGKDSENWRLSRAFQRDFLRNFPKRPFKMFKNF